MYKAYSIENRLKTLNQPCSDLRGLTSSQLNKTVGMNYLSCIIATFHDVFDT